MAFEAVLVIETELPIPLTCAEATGIAKGEVLSLADLAVVAKSGALSIAGGIAGTEKIADDGMVRVDVYRGGIFRVYACGSITTGDALGTTVTNHVISVQSGALSGSKILGTAFEDATDEHTFLMELRPQVSRGSSA